MITRIAVTSGMVLLCTTIAAAAQTYNVDDVVLCDGTQIGNFEKGTVKAIEPRPGWPDPWFMVQLDASRPGDLTRCVERFMKKADTAPAAAPATAAAAPAGAGEPFAIGDSVMCDGTQIGNFERGVVKAIEPRTGWPDPWFMVQLDASRPGDLTRCVARFMRKADPAPAAAAPAAPPARAAAPAAAPAVAANAPPASPLCQVGNKLEAALGISWYAATVLAPPDERGFCLVHYDGYPALYDIPVGPTSLRPSGSGPIVRPSNPLPEPAATARQAAPAQTAQAGAAGAPPNGAYSCHKMSPGAPLMQVGAVDVAGGIPRFRGGLPDGWTLRAIRYQGRNAQGQPLITVEYTSAAGFNDKLDCVPE
jgi:hypothetical protein